MVPVFDPRPSWQAFEAGVREGWSSRELFAWCEELARAGVLLPSGTAEPGEILVREGRVAVALAAGRALGFQDETDVDLAMQCARDALIGHATRLSGSTRDDRFVTAAIYRGQLERRGGRWEAALREGETLSGWGGTLLALDVLGHRDELETELRVCELCSAPSLRRAPACSCRRTSGVFARPSSDARRKLG